MFLELQKKSQLFKIILLVVTTINPTISDNLNFLKTTFRFSTETINIF